MKELQGGRYIEQEGERGGNYGALVRGKDIIDDEVSTDKAIQMFMKMEFESGQSSGGFKPPEDLHAKIEKAQKRTDEIPSAKMARLKRELDELQGELLELEKDEIPNNLGVDP